MPEALDFMRSSNILKKSGFTDSGKGETQRTAVLALEHAYHGDTFKAMEVGDDDLDFADLTYISDEKIKEIEERTTGDDDIKITSMTVEVKNEEIRRINADDIQVGDRFEYNGVEYTVKSLQGDQPDTVKVLYNEIDFTNRNYDVITNIDKYVLAQQAAYLGRDEYLLDDPTISIDKYSFKIDFDSIREISFVSQNEEYIGGLDSDGHERKDNFGVSERAKAVLSARLSDELKA